MKEDAVVINKNRRSPIWTIPKEDLQILLNNIGSFCGVLRHLGVRFSGSVHQTLAKRISEDNLDVTRILDTPWTVRGNRGKLGKNFTRSRRSLGEILVERSDYNRYDLKRRLIKEGLLENKCSDCGSPPEWMGKPLSLQIDHKNGVYNDNRIENLHLLCPNCHSQTETFGSKRFSKKCPRCGVKIKRRAKSCFRCIPWADNAVLRRKVKERPSADSLKESVLSVGYKATGKIYGVSSHTVKDWLIKGGVEPPRFRK